MPPRCARIARARSAGLLASATLTLTGLAACTSSSTTAKTSSSGPGTSSAAPSPSPSLSLSVSPSTASRGSSASPTPTAPFQVQTGSPAVITTGLAVPWGVAFLADGSALVSERDSHRIVRVSSTGQATPVGVVPGVAADAGEGGLLGLALSPRFAGDHRLYAYLTSASDNRVVQMTYADGRLGTPTPVFTGIPKAGNHDGGRIAFGPDGLLYVSTGDATQPERAPDRSYLGGKILRMTAAGAPAPGNPDPSSVVFTVGHRNPQGLAWGPDGRLYEAEFGQDSLDEINLIQAGRDYGWPTDEGTNGPTRSGLTRPLLTWRTSDASPSGLAYAGGSLWLAALRGERLYRIPVLAGGALGAPSELLAGTYGRLRTVQTAPDGSLWITTTNRDGRGSPVDGDDRIIRLPLNG